MENVLYVSASVRKFHPTQQHHMSISRMLGETFIDEFKQQYNQAEVIHRDLSLTPPMFIDEAFIAAAFARGELSEQQRTVLAQSDRLIDEVIKADIIVLSSPMYNYGMPAVLKAWFDLVIRVDKTFSFDLARGDQPLEPILSGKKVVLLASWGEFDFKKGEAKYEFNHLSRHIEQLSPYLGADAFYEIASEYQEFGDERHRASKQQALADIKRLAQKLAAAK
ncbi:NAD(P)H-dependent oxidoreductase [Motilimonas cestriensis]|uniref:FMN dependent NADH:quinone oxidoreductase n=1 Tax=Motilimonas cestriensis TaxID=2742685 RepID=A0ABS8W5L0_9GAMM|nr:NAD(P)H-dependent oxidoreductase [Motilimonas cestriensis]MCE2593367.1 NAD(P)H-dependent oxidoreductase [Motilimonas cestriensis]